MQMSIEDFVKFKQLTAEHISTYRNSITGEEYQMSHPDAEHKRRVDDKHRKNGTLVKE